MNPSFLPWVDVFLLIVWGVLMWFAVVGEEDMRVPTIVVNAAYHLNWPLLLLIEAISWITLHLNTSLSFWQNLTLFMCGALPTALFIWGLTFDDEFFVDW